MNYSTDANWTPLDTERLLSIARKARLVNKLIYAVSDQVTSGKVMHMKETDTIYECYIFHSKDEAQATAASTGLTLLHMLDAPRKISMPD